MKKIEKVIASGLTIALMSGAISVQAVDKLMSSEQQEILASYDSEIQKNNTQNQESAEQVSESTVLLKESGKASEDRDTQVTEPIATDLIPELNTNQLSDAEEHQKNRGVFIKQVSTAFGHEKDYETLLEKTSKFELEPGGNSGTTELVINYEFLEGFFEGNGGIGDRFGFGISTENQYTDGAWSEFLEANKTLEADKSDVSVIDKSGAKREIKSISRTEEVVKKDITTGLNVSGKNYIGGMFIKKGKIIVKLEKPIGFDEKLTIEPKIKKRVTSNRVITENVYDVTTHFYKIPDIIYIKPQSGFQITTDKDEFVTSGRAVAYPYTSMRNMGGLSEHPPIKLTDNLSKNISVQLFDSKNPENILTLKNSGKISYTLGVVKLNGDGTFEKEVPIENEKDWLEVIDWNQLTELKIGGGYPSHKLVIHVRRPNAEPKDPSFDFEQSITIRDNKPPQFNGEITIPTYYPGQKVPIENFLSDLGFKNEIKDNYYETKELLFAMSITEDDGILEYNGGYKSPTNELPSSNLKSITMPKNTGKFTAFTDSIKDPSDNSFSGIGITYNVEEQPQLELEGNSLDYKVDVKANPTIARPVANQKSKVIVKNANVPGYNLTVKRLVTGSDNEFKPNKLKYSQGEFITNNEQKIMTTTGFEKEEFKIDLQDVLSFQELTPSELKLINSGQNTVELSWNLVTDASKIVSAESL